MFSLHDLLNDSKMTFRYRGNTFTLSKLRIIDVDKSIVEQCYRCLGLHEEICICEFKALVDMKFINYCYKMVLKHNYFDSDLHGTEKFIENSEEECKNIANMLINTSLQLSTRFDEFTHTQSLIFNLGARILSEEQKSNDKNDKFEQAKKNAACFTGENK